MKDAVKTAEKALSEVFEHWYHGFPEFAEGEEPDVYAAYTVNEKPVNFASGISHARSYWFTVNIISGRYDNELYLDAEEAFLKYGFIYSGGTDVSGYETSHPYPKRYQYTMDFIADENC